MTSLTTAAQLFKRVLEVTPVCSRGLTDRLSGTTISRPITTSSQSTVLRRYNAPENTARQQCAFKKSKANTKGGKGGGGKKGKGQLSQLNTRLLENFMPDHLDMVEINGRIVNEISALSRTLVAINVSSSPAVLATVFVRIGVEKMPVTDLCDIIAEYGKPIILDCSVYPEAKEKILEAVNKDTAFDAVVHGGDSIKLVSPKLTNDLRKKLVLQSKTQTNLVLDSVRSIRNEAHNTALNARGHSKEVQKRAADNVHQMFLHHKAEIDKVFKAKEKSLQEEFNL